MKEGNARESREKKFHYFQNLFFINAYIYYVFAQGQRRKGRKGRETA